MPFGLALATTDVPRHFSPKMDLFPPPCPNCWSADVKFHDLSLALTSEVSSYGDSRPCSSQYQPRLPGVEQEAKVQGTA